MKKAVGIFVSACLLFGVAMVGGGCAERSYPPIEGKSAIPGGAGPITGGDVREERLLKVADPESSAVAQKVKEPFSLLNQANATVPVQDRQIIYKAELLLETLEVEKTQERVFKLVGLTGGFIESSTVSVAYRGGNTQIVSRIPVKSFEKFIVGLKKLGKLLEESREAEDVTRQIADQEARRKNLLTTEKRLLELKSRAGKIGDLLEVDREISRVIGERESLEAQLRVLKDQVAYSTVTVMLQPPAGAATSATKPDEPVYLPLGEEWRDVRMSVVSTLRGFLSLGLWGVGYSFIWLPALAFYLIRRKRNAGKKVAGK